MKPGSVPTARVAPILRALIKDRWPYSREDVFSVSDLVGGYTVLADKVDCDPTTIERIVEQKNEGVDFDLVDRLFCALGRPDVWRGELLDVYQEMEFVQRCALHSCSKTFPEKWNARRKLYCSVNCRTLAAHVARGSRPGDRFLAKGYCQSGRHKMTPENTRTHSDGSRYCRECDREKKSARNARYNAKRRALAVLA